MLWVFVSRTSWPIAAGFSETFNVSERAMMSAFRTHVAVYLGRGKRLLVRGWYLEKGGR